MPLLIFKIRVIVNILLFYIDDYINASKITVVEVSSSRIKCGLLRLAAGVKKTVACSISQQKLSVISPQL
jgi:hypothetical protein